MKQAIRSICVCLVITSFFGAVPALAASVDEALPDVSKSEVDTSLDLEDAVQKALEYMSARDTVRAEPMLQKVISDPAFDQLDADKRHAVLFAAGYIARQSRQWQKAWELYARSSAMKEATGKDWLERMQVAYMLEDRTDVVRSLTTIADSWPGTLQVIPDRSVYWVASQAKDLADQNAYFNLLNTLFNRYWKPGNGREPSALWRELALELIERNQLQRAAQVASMISSPRELATMQADARFYPVLDADPARFDVETGLAREIALLRETAREQPRILEHLIELTYSLLAARQYTEVLEISDRAIAAVSSGDERHVAFDDIDTKLYWIMNNRSRALRRLDRWDEAIQELVRASSLKEGGEDNVSQALNLGNLLVFLNRPKEALVAIANVKNASPYGLMQLEYVKFIAAHAQGDTKAAEQSMTYMREHHADAENSYEEVLLIADRQEEAAKLLIARLNDPVKRSSALFDIQDFTDGSQPTPLEKLLNERYKALLQRADVQAALSKVGRIVHYDIDRPVT